MALRVVRLQAENFKRLRAIVMADQIVDAIKREWKDQMGLEAGQIPGHNLATPVFMRRTFQAVLQAMGDPT